MTVQKVEKDRPELALVVMTGSALAFAIVAAFVKNLIKTVPDYELVFYRSLVNLIIVSGIMLLKRQSFAADVKRLLILRGVFGFISLLCMFYAAGALPLPIASLLSWSSPLFVILFSRVFLREHIKMTSLIWIVLAFTGIAMIIHPNFGLNSMFKETQAISLRGVIIALLGAAGGALGYVAIRAAISRVGINLIVFYLSLVATILAAPMTFHGYHPLDGRETVKILIMGVCASAGQFLMTYGYRHAPAGIVSMMSLLTTAFSASIGFFVFGERLAMGQWAGIAVLAMAVVLLTASSRPRAQPAPSTKN